MSTPFDNLNAKFQQDNNQLLADAQAVQDQINEAAADQKNFQQRLDKLSTDPELAMLQLFFILYASPGDNTAGGGIQDQIGITGAQLKLNADLTNVGGDLQNMVNSNANDPGCLTTFANDASTFKAELAPGSTALPSGVIDPETQSSLYNNISQIRSYFDVSNASVPSDNGTLANSYFADSGTDPNDTKIQSFQEFQTLLNQQGDAKNSTDVAQYMTNDFSTNTQTTQTASAVLDNDMKTYSPLLQAIQQFASAIAQLINAVKKASINGTAAGA